MRHKRIVSHFGRKPSARKALIRGLVDAIVEHGRIRTTVHKAKELRRHVERAVTKGKKGTVHARRVLLSDYPNQNTVKKICDDISVRFKERPGGYTRITKLGTRPGDCAEMAYIEWVDFDSLEKPEVKELGAREQIRKAAKVRRRKRKLQQKDRQIFRQRA